MAPRFFAPSSFRGSPRGDLMPPKVGKLAGLGAFGACAGFAALFTYVAYLSLPATTGGMMMSQTVVVWISLSLVVVALIAVHVMLGKQLLHLANGDSRPV